MYHRMIARELRVHAPFTAFGAGTGILLMAAISILGIPRTVVTSLFWIFHPLHVLLSALVTAGMYRRHGRGKLLPTMLIGYFGSVGIATVSDSIIPYLGEWVMALPHRQAHLGFIEKWWLVNPLAIAGVSLAYFRPSTRFPHAGHVLLSTWASLFHIMMAIDFRLGLGTLAATFTFLFVAVWVPCCTSDIVFPLFFAGVEARLEGAHRTLGNHAR